MILNDVTSPDERILIVAQQHNVALWLVSCNQHLLLGTKPLPKIMWTHFVVSLTTRDTALKVGEHSV